MASEIRVNKIINRSGLSTVTFSDTGAIVSGIVTANSFSGNVTGNVTGAVTGSGANLTSIPAGQLTGTVADARLTSVTASKLSGALPALDGSALTGINTAFGSGTSVNTTGIITATAFVPSAQGSLSHRNLVINGAMRVAQRATSSTANGYGDLDRWQHEYASTDENPTFAQVSLATSDTPYTLGLTKTAKITNGNQTSGLQSSSQINFNQNMEAQDIRNSGWNYKSSSSYITLSFWVRASVSQNYHGFVKTGDGSMYSYSYETGTLSANTWTKITKAIPGNSNLQIDDDTGNGFQIFPIAIYGTGFTDNSISNDAWKSWSSGTRTKDQTSTWYTTNDATLEITGVQLEVGAVSTPFEHRSFGEELYRCQRYFELLIWEGYGFYGYQPNGNAVEFQIRWNVEKRANPSITLPATGTGSGQIGPTNVAGSNMSGGSLAGPFTIKKTTARITGGGWSGGSSGAPCALYSGGSPGAIIKISSDL